MEISHPIPAPVPPTQPGRGITACQKSDKKGKEQNINLELLQAGNGSCSGLRGEPHCGAEDAPNPFAQGNSVRSIRSIFDPCCSARASASLSSLQRREVLFLSLHEFDRFHQVFDHSLYWPKFLTELLTTANGSSRLWPLPARPWPR